ncbi:MAG: rhodanese-like domain-containing protein [Gaiellales bacterium]|nr:MAG: rhodanese-like domain-containing protein [Gaiellales bacterium]
MERFRKLFLLSIVLLGLLLSTTVGVLGCGEEKTETKADEKTTETKADTSTQLADRIITVLASTETSGDYAANAIAADVLAAKLADPAEKEKLTIVDIRKKEDFDKGHIEGAINIAYQEWASMANMAMLPAENKIIVVCYSGNTAAQTVAGMRILGHDAAALKGGMEAWEAGKAQGTITALEGASNAVVMDPAMNEAAPAPSATWEPLSEAQHGDLMMAVDEYFMNMEGGGLNVITAADLKAKIDSGETAEMTLLDIRSAEDFTGVGHIEGAVNVPFKAVAVPDNLSLLSKDKQVVVICYTGNTAAQAVTALNLLGYDAIALKYGMMGWTQTPNTAGFISYLNAASYPVVQ